MREVSNPSEQYCYRSLAVWGPNHAFNADPNRRAFGPGRWGRLTWFR